MKKDVLRKAFLVTLFICAGLFLILVWDISYSYRQSEYILSLKKQLTDIGNMKKIAEEKLRKPIIIHEHGKTFYVFIKEAYGIKAGDIARLEAELPSGTIVKLTSSKTKGDCVIFIVKQSERPISLQIHTEKNIFKHVLPSSKRISKTSKNHKNKNRFAKNEAV